MENKSNFTADDSVVRRDWHKYFSEEFKFRGNQLTSTPNRTPIKGPPKGAIIVKKINYFDLFCPSSPSEGGTKGISDDATGSILEDSSCSATLEASNLQCPSPKRMKIAEEVPSSSDACSDSTSGDEDVTVPYNDTDCGLC